MSEEKSNIEKLGEDLKGVASDVANSEAVKTVKEKLSEAAESEMAQKAKKKISEVANSEAAQKAKEKVSDAAKAAKEKLDELSEDERVKAAKAQAMGYIAKAKVWIVDNWHAGRNGKFKVAAAFVVAFFVLKGVLSFFGGDKSAPASAGSSYSPSYSVTENYYGGGSSESSSTQSSGPQEKTWICGQCGHQVRAKYIPPQTKCSAFHGQRDGSVQRNCRWKPVY